MQIIFSICTLDIHCRQGSGGLTVHDSLSHLFNCPFAYPLIPSGTLWASWAQKPFCVPFTEFQRAGSKQLLIREERGYRERDEQSKEAIAQPWAWIMASPPGTHMTKQCLRVVLQILKPPPRGRSEPYSAHNHIGPGTLEPEGW